MGDVKKIGVLGGTFNPVHNGHLRMAREARGKFGLEKVIFIPTALPPHKTDRELLPARDRLEMLHRAIRNHPEYEVSDIELRRGGKSYTVDTVRQLKESLGPDTEIYLIIGADNLLEIADWKEIKALVQLGHFIVVTRPGFALEKLSGKHDRWARKVLECDCSNLLRLILPHSSREIRERARKGEDLTGQVSPEVAAYIRQKGLYRPRPDI